MARYGLIKTGVMKWRIADTRAKPYKGRPKLIPGSYTDRRLAVARLDALNATAERNDTKRRVKQDERSLEHWRQAQEALVHAPAPIRQYKDD